MNEADVTRRLFGGADAAKVPSPHVLTPFELETRRITHAMQGLMAGQGETLDEVLASLSEEDLRRLYRLATHTGFESWIRTVDAMADPPMLYDSRHITLLCEALDDVASGYTQRLIVNMPPRHGKSRLITIRFAVYLMMKYPHFRVMVGCYNRKLAIDFSQDARALAREQGLELSREQSRVDFWKLARGGSYQACGVGGSPATGFGGNLCLVDDPIRDATEADSPAYRKRVWEWFTKTFYTRRQPGAPVIIVTTRWHADDLVGRLTRQMESGEGDNWRVINLEAIKEGTKDDGTGRLQGEALFPAMWPLEELNKIKRQLGRGFYALYQGRPVPDEGATFQAANFLKWDHGKIVTGEPTKWAVLHQASGAKIQYDLDTLQLIITSDVAGKKSNDSNWTVFGVWSVGTRRELILRRVYREHIEGSKIPMRAKGLQEIWNAALWCVDRRGLGLPIVQGMQDLGIPVRGVAGHKDKVAMAEGASYRYEAGLIFHPETNEAWLHEFEAELLEFPAGRYDDQVDMLSMAVAAISGVAIVFEEFNAKAHTVTFSQAPRRLVVGWGLHPAPSIICVDGDPDTAMVHAAMVGEIGQEISTFAAKAGAFIAERFPSVKTCEHVGPEGMWGTGNKGKEDTAARRLIAQATEVEGESIIVLPDRSSRRERERWIRERLTRLYRGRPAILLAMPDSAALCEALSGGYQKRVNTTTGQPSEDPERTWHMSVVDALGHALSRLPSERIERRTLEDEEDEEDGFRRRSDGGPTLRQPGGRR